MTQTVPDGFTPCRYKDPFSQEVATFYQKGEPPDLVFGMEVEPRHANLNGVIHGGVLFSFADSFMGLLLEQSARRLTATISLNVEFVGNIQPEGWIEGRPTLVRLARTVAFLRGEIMGGDQTLMTASGIWRVFDEPSGRFT